MKKLFLALGALVLSLPLHALTLELKDHQSLVGAEMTLDDLLQSSDGLSADDLNVVIGSAPELGGTETWTRDRIVSVLPESIKAQTVNWTGAASCVVTRPSSQYDDRQVRQIITAELAKHLPPSSEFAVIETPGLDSFSVPKGELETQVDLTAGTMRSEWGEATIRFLSQGRLAVTKNVRFHWTYNTIVWQATAPVKSGEHLTASSFQQVSMNVLKLPGTMQPIVDFPEGKVAAHALSTGRVLMQNDQVEPILVTRDDVVTVSYDYHGISITVQAKAMTNGMRNEVIAVQNLTSHKVFTARVVDERSLVYDH